MTTYFPPKVNTQYIFYASLVSQANTKIMQVNPTIAAGDFKVSIDGGALNNLGTLPTVTPAAGVMVKFTLSTSEMNGANITVVCSDAAGSEWCDAVFNIQTTARQIDDLAYPATSGRSMVVDANGLVDANTVKVGPTGSGTAQTAKDIGGAVPAVAAGASGGLLISGSNAGTTTLGALTITGATTHTGNVSMAAGCNITQSSANTSALVVTGNGTGHGAIFTSGSGVTGDGLKAVSAATNGNGVTFTKTGSGSDLNATVTPLTLAKTTNITGFNDIAATAIVSSGAITTSGGAVSTVTTVTNQLTAAAIATGVWTDTTAGDFTAANSIGKSIMNGVALGTGLTVNAVTGLTASNLDVAVSTRMATYTQPTGFLAATFPGTVASPTNITSASGVTLTSAYDFAKGTVAMTESYAAQGATMTPAQALYQINQHLGESSISGTTKTVKKRDAATTAKTFTLNSATTPTSVTETT